MAVPTLPERITEYLAFLDALPPRLYSQFAQNPMLNAYVWNSARNGIERADLFVSLVMELPLGLQQSTPADILEGLIMGICVHDGGFLDVDGYCVEDHEGEC